MKSNSSGASVIYVITLAIFAISIYFISERNSNILEQIRDEFRLRSQIPDSLLTSKAINIEKELLSQLLSEVKYYNEILNREQNDTLSYIVYIIAFFSIVAGFFGYRTIRDIRESVKEESRKITEFYEKTFTLLNNQANISKEFYDLQYRGFEEKIKRAEIDLYKLIEHQNELEARYSRSIEQEQNKTDAIKKDTIANITPNIFEGGKDA